MPFAYSNSRLFRSRVQPQHTDVNEPQCPMTAELEGTIDQCHSLAATLQYVKHPWTEHSLIKQINAIGPTAEQKGTIIKQHQSS